MENETKNAPAVESAPASDVTETMQTPKPKKTTKKTAKKAAKKVAKKTAKKAAPKKATKKATAKKVPRDTWDYDFEEQEVFDSFALNLVEARNAAGMTQGQLAEVINYSRIAICNMERAKNGATLTTLLRICSALKTTPDTLLRKRG